MFTFPSFGTTVVYEITGNQHCLDNTKWMLIDSTAEGDSREALYQYVSSEMAPAEAPNFRVGIYPNRKANGGEGATNVSLKLVIPTIKTVGELAMGYVPTTFTFAWTVPGLQAVFDAVKFVQLFVSMVSLALPLDEGDATTAARFTALSYNVPEILGIALPDES